MSTYVAFLMYSGGEFQTEGMKEEKARSPFVLHCLIEWNFEEMGVGTGEDRSRRRVQMQKVREIGKGGRGDDVETEACNLTGNSGSDTQQQQNNQNDDCGTS